MEEAFLSPAAQRSLVERVVAGDRSAEDELVRWFHGRVFATLVCRTGDREASRDLTQDVMLAALRALRAGSVEEPERLAQFMHGIARNLAYTHIRTASLRRPREHTLPPEMADRIAAPLREAQEEAEAWERNIGPALDGLQPGDRDILILTMEGRKPHEIAARMNLPSGVLRQRKRRAIQKVRDSLRKLSRIGPAGYFTRGKGPG